MRRITAIVLTATLAACASGYSQFYTALPGATPEAIASTRAAPPPTRPLVNYSAGVPDPDQYARLGYVPIGYSSFNSGRNEPEKEAVSQGQKVGADLVVIVNPSYTGSVTNQVPLTTPTTSTSYTSGTATAYGSGGSATAYGNSTTTTHGTQTTYIPITVSRYDYGAVYFVKRKFIFGATWRALTNEERAARQTNSGVFITTVVNDTPAFRNDVLAGDILLKIDGQAIYGEEAVADAFEQRRGKAVNLTLWRNGALIDKTIVLGQ